MTPALAPYHLLSWIWNCYFFVLTHWNNAALASLGATAVGAGVRDLSVVSVPLERLKFCRWSANSAAKSSSPVRSTAGCSGAVRGCDAALARCISAVEAGAAVAVGAAESVGAAVTVSAVVLANCGSAVARLVLLR